jgi:hypothetical protein
MKGYFGNYPRVVLLYLILALFAIPHLIDDFLYGVPADFGISNQTAQILAGFFIVIYLGLLIPLVEGKRGGLYGVMGMGIFLALAGILKHIPLILQPGPYWSGWFSEALIAGLILSGITLSVTVFAELIDRPESQEGGPGE